jgi:hypothetical protein
MLFAVPCIVSFQIRKTHPFPNGPRIASVSAVPSLWSHRCHSVESSMSYVLSLKRPPISRNLIFFLVALRGALIFAKPSFLVHLRSLWLRSLSCSQISTLCTVAFQPWERHGCLSRPIESDKIKNRHGLSR